MQLSLTRPSHRTSRRIFMTLNVLIIIYSCVSAQPYKTQTCLKHRNKTVYTCEANQMIHVISKLYQEALEDCEVPDDACEVTEDTLSNGFITDCNGKVICNEDTALIRISKACYNFATVVVTTLYECICDPPVNVCSTIVPWSRTHTLFLTSPNFPEYNNADNRGSVCECVITGTYLSVEILEISFLFSQSIRANLTLTGDISSWESYPNTFLMYNQKVIPETNSLHVKFNAYNRNSQRMWIRISGTTDITTQCNYVATSTTSSSSTSSISSRLTSMTITTVTPNKSRCQDTSTIIGVLSGVVVILLLVIAALVIYFKCVKPRRMSSSNSTERRDEAHQEYVTDNQGYGVQNDTQNTSDNTPADYADLRHYGNMDNVYTGLGTQGNMTVVSENSYSHLQTYASDNAPHEYSDL